METPAINFSRQVLEQLGGNKFTAMTGSKNFLYAEQTENNPMPWLRMDLARNAGKVNRLKITLDVMDTYTMEFYHQSIKGYTEVIIRNEQTFKGIYSDMLQEIFKKVTGMDTHL